VACDERGLVGDEERDRGRALLRRAEAAERRSIRQLLLERLRQVAGEIRDDEPRRDRVAGDAPRRKLARRRLRQPDETRLRRRIVGLTHLTSLAADRRDVDDPPG